MVADIPWESRKIQVGDSVHVGFVIGRIPDIRTIRVVADLPDVDDGTVSVGMPVEVALDAYPDRTFPGTIEHIGPIAQEKSRLSMRRSFPVRIRLEAIDAAIMRPGLSARIEVKTGEMKDSLLVPRGAIDFSSGTPAVELARGGRREIKVGRCNATQCVVTNGLDEGVELVSMKVGS